MSSGVVGVTIGVLLAVWRGGRPSHPREWDLDWTLPILLALAALVATRLGLTSSGLVAASALGLLFSGCMANLHLPGTGVLAVGLLANLVPLALVGATPVDNEALAAVGADPASLLPTQTLLVDGTAVPLLASRIPVPLVGQVLSFGDLIAAAGLGALVHSVLMLGLRPRGIPVRQILEAGPLTIPADPAPAASPAPAAEWPVEVGPGRPVPIPLGWAGDDEWQPEPAVVVSHRSRAHPTMRLGHR